MIRYVLTGIIPRATFILGSIDTSRAQAGPAGGDVVPARATAHSQKPLHCPQEVNILEFSRQLQVHDR